MAKNYQRKNEIQHVYDIPDTYIGNIEVVEDEDFLYDLTENKYYKTTFKKCEGIERLFLEALSNAGNNVDETRRERKDPGAIWITVDDKIITIKNTGNVIPIEKNKENPEFWNPEMIFGVMRTSSNYDPGKPRMGCGRNGFGAKLINIFSKVFKVKVRNVEQELEYVGEWRENMSRHKINKVREIQVGKRDSSFVEVEWLLDFERFKIEGYSDDMIRSFARYAVDFSFTCKVPIYFNGIKISAQKCSDFITYFLNEKKKKSLFYYEWEPSFEPDISDGKIDYTRHIARVEAILIDTPYKGTVHSYVNGLITKDGGAHVDSFTKVVYKKIAELFGAKFNLTKISAKDIKPHLTLILNCRLANPTYTSQSKTKLGSPNIQINFPEEYYAKIMKWDCIEGICNFIENKQLKKLKKTDGRKVRHVASEKGEDANMAGSKKSDECDFYIIEGNSAAQYAKRRRDHIGGKDRNGYCSVRGKPLNVTNASFEKLRDNEEFNLIKKFLGLAERTDYSLEENRQKLRYGRVIICTDADTDGLHICQLIYNFFKERFPSLVEMGLIYRLQIAMIKVYEKKGKIVQRYYSEQEFQRDQELYSEKKYNIKYFKGLATSSPEDVKDDIFNACMIRLKYDEDGFNTLTWAMDKKFKNVRKAWIEEYDPNLQPTYYPEEDIKIVKSNGKGKDKGHISIPSKYQNITNFIRTEGILYTMESLIRCIPMVNDGLKESQRKILYYVLKEMTIKSKPIKVAILSAKVSSDTNYAHGPDPLEETIMGMVSNYVGSNNLSIFEADGLFATRDDGGNKKDVPAGRYPSVKIAKWCHYAFLKELRDLVPQKVEENIKIEQVYIPCIIPFGLINGFNGIATGFSTNCPNYSLKDIFHWLEAKLSGAVPGQVRPWYRGFLGELKINKKVVKEIPTVSEEEKEDDDEKEKEIAPTEEEIGYSLKSYGDFDYEEVMGENGKKYYNVEITEIPVGISLKRYRRFLEKLREEKKLKEFRDDSTTEVPHYYLTQLEMEKLSHEELYLIKSFPLSNINMLNEQGLPKHYNTVYEVLEEYYQIILNLFSQLYQVEMTNLAAQVKKNQEKIHFIQLVLDGRIEILGKSRKSILKLLEMHNVDYDIYKATSSEDYSTESLLELHNKVSDLTLKIQDLADKTPEYLWLEKLLSLKKMLIKLDFYEN